MPVNITIRKAGNTNTVAIDPHTAEVLLSKQSDPDGKCRIQITAETDVKFQFADAGTRAMFEAAGAEPFRLKPGAKPLVLTLKPSLGIGKRPKQGGFAKAFKSTSDGKVDTRFTASGNFEFLEPKRSAHHDHNDLHVEC